MVRRAAEPFSEKSFYLAEFRGRTLALAAAAEELAGPAPLVTLLDELAGNPTRVVLLTDGFDVGAALAGGVVVRGDAPRFGAAVWRALSKAPHVAVAVEPGPGFAPTCHRLALELGVAKLMWVERGGGLRKPDGTRISFMGLAQLREWLAADPLTRGGQGEAPERLALLREIEATLSAGLAAVNLSTLEGLADELFSYAGSGTLFTRERYVAVRPLSIDDYDAADDLIARGVAEGYLAPRSAEEVDRILGAGFGAFVEGQHLAGIGALLPYREERTGEISSLYTLTRFLGEGVGGHLVAFALERARAQGFERVFACTTSERVARFFTSQGFREIPLEAVPASKWTHYDPARRPHLRALERGTLGRAG